MCDSHETSFRTANKSLSTKLLPKTRTKRLGKPSGGYSHGFEEIGSLAADLQATTEPWRDGHNSPVFSILTETVFA
jgi:hypothetical protein